MIFVSRISMIITVTSSCWARKTVPLLEGRHTHYGIKYCLIDHSWPYFTCVIQDLTGTSLYSQKRQKISHLPVNVAKPATIGNFSQKIRKHNEYRKCSALGRSVICQH